MIKFIDNFLNRITMYRLVLYYVSGLWIAAFIFSFSGLLPYIPLDLLVSVVFIVACCLIVNTIFAKVFEAPSNIESVYTTGIILALIVSPAQPFDRLLFFGVIATLAMASKYIISIYKKHIFNPAAFAVAVSAIAVNQSANWWVGNLYIMPFVLIGGLLVVRKIRRFDLVVSFLIVAVGATLAPLIFKGIDSLSIFKEALLYSPALFFAFAMLTEPMTTPPTTNLRIVYGVLTGLLFAPFVHIGSMYFTPELALLAGNIFVYVVSPKHKFVLELKEKLLIAPDIYDFLFKPDKYFLFKPGQYMEWTLEHEQQDVRGMRRYFTIASSPADKYIRVGVKFFPNSSSYKQSLLSLNPGDKIVASQLAGDFILPKNIDKKLVFIAGGIGVTPFRSIIQHLIDINEKRDIVMLYSNYTVEDIVYQDVFDQAEKQLGIKIIYALSNSPFPNDWKGERGLIDKTMIMHTVPDYKERTFYLSGSHKMVVAFDEILQKMGIKKRQIKKDFFPGFV